jgi:hypothetical protein
MNKDVKKEIMIAVIVLLSFIGLFMICGFVIIKSSKVNNEFYEKNCPQLNSTYLRPIDTILISPCCTREINGVLYKYYIIEQNDRYYLREIRTP